VALLVGCPVLDVACPPTRICQHADGECSLRRALNEYVEHYHAEWNHQGKGNVLLFPRDTDIRRKPQPVQCREQSDALLRYYHQEAA